MRSSSDSRKRRKFCPPDPPAKNSRKLIAWRPCYPARRAARQCGIHLQQPLNECVVTEKFAIFSFTTQRLLYARTAYKANTSRYAEGPVGKFFEAPPSRGLLITHKLVSMSLTAPVAAAGGNSTAHVQRHCSTQSIRPHWRTHLQPFRCASRGRCEASGRSALQASLFTGPLDTSLSRLALCTSGIVP